MKALLWLPAAVLAGIVIGAWGPREEIRALKKDFSDSESGRRNAANGFQAFAKIVNIPEEAKRPHRRKPSVKPLFRSATNRPPAKAVSPAKAGSPAVAAKETSVTNTISFKPKRMTPEDLRARIEEAQELWKTRVDLATAQWKDKFNLEGKASEQFDAAIEEMNEQLYDTMQAMAALLANREKMTPELGLRMIGDVTTIMAETYEKIGACVPAERRPEVSEMQVFDFIDPGVAEPLIEVQDKLGDMRPRGLR